MRTAVFDLDGTLVDTAQDMLTGANAVFDALGHGMPLNVEDHAATAFAGGRAMLEMGASVIGLDWSADDIAKNYPVFLEAYSDNLHRASALYPGALGALDALEAAGWKLAVCTNKPEALAERLLQSLGVRDRFAAMLGADTLAVRKPDPVHLFETVARAGGDRSRSVLVGDTITDARTAQAASIPVILVGFGPIGEGVSEFGPDEVLHSYADLAAMLERMVPLT